MAIKIIKKRSVEAPVRPEPVVEAPAPAPEPVKAERPTPPITPYREPTLCSFCEHYYIEPCHGKSDRCMNAKWKRDRLAQEKK